MVEFGRVIGHKGIKSYLAQSIERDMYAPVYLFEGPQGVGKATLALEFAKAINCIDKENIPCDRCSHCNKMNHFTHPDLWLLLPNIAELRDKLGQDGELRPQEYDPYREITISQVRELQIELSRPPFEATRRIVLILNGENMNIPTQNAFLKTLEEPPENTSFIIVSHSTKGILPTILSRTRRIKFNRLSYEDFSSYPFDERYSKTLLYRLSSGSIGIAKLLVRSPLINQREEILDAVIQGNLKDITATVGKLRQDKREIEVFLYIFQSLLRDVIVIKSGERSLIHNIDLPDKLYAVSRRLKWGSIEEILSSLKRGEEALRRYVNLNLIIYPIFKGFLSSS